MGMVKTFFYKTHKIDKHPHLTFFHLTFSLTSANADYLYLYSETQSFFHFHPTLSFDTYFEVCISIYLYAFCTLF